jgi:integrase
MACIRKRRGKWVVDYRDGAGIRRWVTCATRRDADAILDEKRRESRQGTRPVVDPDITLEDYSKRWLGIVQATVKRATYESYDNTLRLHILPIFAGVKVRQLQRGRIREWLAGRIKAGYARESVRIMQATLRAILNAAIDDGVIVANPSSGLTRQLKLTMTAAHRQEEIKAMTGEQVVIFLETAEREAPPLAPLFLLLARSGMRIGEALALQWDDVDYEGREIRVARAFSKGRLETPKSGVARTVDMSAQLARTLRRLHVERKAETLRRGWSGVPPWVFCTQHGTAFDLAFVQRVFKRVVKAAKLPLHFTPHCLRHTYASLMLQMGQSPVYVQRQLGHASIKLTVDTYGKWLPMGNKAAVDRLDSLGAPPSGHAPSDGHAINGPVLRPPLRPTLSGPALSDDGDDDGSRTVAASGGGAGDDLQDAQLGRAVNLVSW